MANDTLGLDAQEKVIEKTRKTPGNIYVNPEHGQLRYGDDDSGVLNWIQPMPVHVVGNRVMRGQPVSIGFPDDFEPGSYVRLSGVPLIVPTNPVKHQIPTGIALEPGDATQSGADSVHVVTEGQIKYDKKDGRFRPADANNPYYMPPFKRYFNGTEEIFSFEWSYEQVGKPVYVDGRPDHLGELTMNIEEAYANGSNICTIGRLADAPRKRLLPNLANASIDATGKWIKGTNVSGSTSVDVPEDTNIVIDVQIMGDSRGLTDSTEFSVTLDSLDNSYRDGSGVPSGVVNTAGYDMIRLVKVYYGTDGRILGRVVMGDPDLKYNGNDGSPIGAFIAKSGESYANKTIVIHRLGIIRGDFMFSNGDVGRELQLSMGDITVNGGSTSYEYKVGVVLDPKRVLIDCRFIREFKKYAPVGEVKPIYVTGKVDGLPDADDLVKEYVEPGYIAVDKTPHPVYDVSNSTPAKGELYNLIDTIMYKNMVKFYATEANAKTGTNPIDIYNPTMKTAADLMNMKAWFVFDDIYYKIGDGFVGSMIKYATEGSPDNMDVVWPWQTFTGMAIDGDTKGGLFPPGGNFRVNITGLVNMGSIVIKDNNDYIDDDFEISLIAARPENESPNVAIQNMEGLILSPGFYEVTVEETYVKLKTNAYTSEKQPPRYSTNQADFPGGDSQVTVTEKRQKVCGFEWKIVREPSASGIGSTYWLTMITDPSTSKDWQSRQYVNPCDIYGPCYPPGKPLRDKHIDGSPSQWNTILPVTVVVRRRPTEYNDLSLNQLYMNMPWNVDVWSDGNGTIGVNSLKFGAKRALFDDSGRVVGVNWDTAHDLDIGLAGKTIVGGDYDQDTQTIGPISTAPEAVEKLSLGGMMVGDQYWTPTVLRQVYQVKNREDLTPITLTYDFTRTAISSNALMAFKYYSPTSAQGATVDATRRWYYDPAEATGKNSDTLVKGRRALNSIYEIPIGLWNYRDDSVLQVADGGPRVSPFDRQFYVDAAPANPISASHDYSNLMGFRKIWDKTQLASQLSMNFKLTDQEAAIVRADRKSLYGRNLADQNIQSNIGLLTQGLSEAHERLLKIERSVYGADLETLPGTFPSDVQLWIGTYGSFWENITNYGSLRLTKKLLDIKFLIDRDPNTDTPGHSLWSWWDNVLSETLGWTASGPSFGSLHHWQFIPGDVPPFTPSKKASNLALRQDAETTIEGGNVSESWFQIHFWLQDWESIAGKYSMPGLIKNWSPFNHGVDDKNAPDIRNVGWFRADHIFFKRNLDSLGDTWFETSANKLKVNVYDEERASGLGTFDITYGKAESSGFSYLADYVFRTTGFGKSDASATDKETYASQSLEGMIHDFTIRFALWKYQYDDKYGIMKSDISMYSVIESDAEEDSQSTDDSTGFLYRFLKTGYSDAAVNFKRPADADSGMLQNKYYNYIMGPSLNRFVTAIGLAPTGKIQIPASMILKGVVNEEANAGAFSEYTNIKNPSTDFDEADLIDHRHPAIRDTRLPILGVYGNKLVKYTKARAPRIHVPPVDPNWISAKDQSSGSVSYQTDDGYDHSLRPSIFRITDKDNDHPNWERYSLEVVADIPRARTWTMFDAVSNLNSGAAVLRNPQSPARAAFDLWLPPEYETKTYKQDLPTPNKWRDPGTAGTADFGVLAEVPENYHGWIQASEKSRTDTETKGNADRPYTLIGRKDIPLWARMKRTGVAPNITYERATAMTDVPFGATFMLNAHQIPVPKIPVLSEDVKIRLPGVRSIVYPIDFTETKHRLITDIWYNEGPDPDDELYTGEIEAIEGTQFENPGNHPLPTSEIGRHDDDLGTQARVFEALDTSNRTDGNEQGFISSSTHQSTVGLNNGIEEDLVTVLRNGDEETVISHTARSTTNPGGGIYEDLITIGREEDTDPDDVFLGIIKSEDVEAEPSEKYHVWYYDYTDIITADDITWAAEKQFVAPSGKTMFKPDVSIDQRLPISLSLRIGNTETPSAKWIQERDYRFKANRLRGATAPITSTKLTISSADQNETGVSSGTVNVDGLITWVNTSLRNFVAETLNNEEDYLDSTLNGVLMTPLNSKLTDIVSTVNSLSTIIGALIDYVNNGTPLPDTNMTVPSSLSTGPISNINFNNEKYNKNEDGTIPDEGYLQVKDVGYSTPVTYSGASSIGVIRLPLENIPVTISSVLGESPLVFLNGDETGYFEVNECPTEAQKITNIIPTRQRFLASAVGPEIDTEGVDFPSAILKAQISGADGNKIDLTTVEIALPDTVYSTKDDADNAGAGLTADAAGSDARRNAGLGTIEELRYHYMGVIPTNLEGNLIDVDGHEIEKDGGGVYNSNTPDGMDEIIDYLDGPDGAPAPALQHHVVPTKWVYDKVKSVQYQRTVGVDYDHVDSVSYKRTTAVDYDHVDSVTYKRTMNVTYDKLVAATIKKPLDLEDIKIETIYTPEMDPTASITYERAVETMNVKLPDQHQTVTILKNQLSALQNLKIDYPNTTTIDTGLVLRPGEQISKGGSLQDANLSWDLKKPDAFKTLDDLAAKAAGESPNTAFSKAWENYTSVDEYSTRTNQVDLKGALTSLPNGTTRNELTSRLNSVLDDEAKKNTLSLAKDSDHHLEYLDRKLELHFHGVLDGTAMPEQALWIDIQNSEIYVKFLKHINKIMKLAIRIEDYKREPDTGAIIRQNQSWPWGNPSKGYAEPYPVTITGTDHGLLPDIKLIQIEPQMKTYEDIMNSNNKSADVYVLYYGKTIGELAQAISTPTSFFTALYTSATLAEYYTISSIIRPGMKFWAVEAMAFVMTGSLGGLGGLGGMLGGL